MDDIRFGSVVRAARQSRGWRQKDLEEKSGVSQSAISRIERGHIGPQSIDSLRRVCGALDIRVEIVPTWRGGDLERLVNRRHSGMHESVARWFRDELPAWVLAPEVSFSIYGERGVIDILAWHPGLRALLVIELKTDIVDVNELVGTFDRKRRLAAQIAKERGWDPVSVSAWLIVGDGSDEPAAGRGARGDAARCVAGRPCRDPAMAARAGWLGCGDQFLVCLEPRGWPGSEPDRAEGAGGLTCGPMFATRPVRGSVTRTGLAD